jgi:hypothetical protein
MTTVIFLDDERDPKDVTWVDYEVMFGECHFHVLNTYRKWYDMLSSILSFGGGFAKGVVFSFDHDIQGIGLDGCEVTGYDCLKSLVSLCLDNKIPLPRCVFHTKNPIGKANMEVYYQNALKFEGEQNV